MYVGSTACNLLKSDLSILVPNTVLGFGLLFLGFGLSDYSSRIRANILGPDYYGNFRTTMFGFELLV